MNALLLSLAAAALAAAPAPAEKTYKVEEGKTEIVAVTGGKVKLTGPAEMKVGARGIELLAGRLLLALPRLGKRRFAVRTAHAVAAVRGTEFYVEALADSTYLCVCEGAIDARAPKQRRDKTMPSPLLTADKEHRHAAYVLTPAAEGLLKSEPAAMRGHADDEFPSLRAP